MSLKSIIEKFNNFLKTTKNNGLKLIQYENRFVNNVNSFVTDTTNATDCYALQDRDYIGVLLGDKTGLKGMYLFNEKIVKGVKILHLELSCLSIDIRGTGISSFLRNIAFDYALQNDFAYITSQTVGPAAFEILEKKIGFDCKGREGRALKHKLGLGYEFNCILDVKNKREKLQKEIDDFFEVDGDIVLDRKVRKANNTNYADSDLSWIVNEELDKRYGDREWFKELKDFFENKTQRKRNALLVSIRSFLSEEELLGDREKEIVQIAIRILRGSREYVLLEGGTKRRLKKSRKYKNKLLKSCRRRRKSGK